LATSGSASPSTSLTAPTKRGSLRVAAQIEVAQEGALARDDSGAPENASRARAEARSGLSRRMDQTSAAPFGIEEHGLAITAAIRAPVGGQPAPSRHAVRPV
jgi:hypothetical protein